MPVVRARRPTATSTSSPRSSPSGVVSTTSVPSRRAALTPLPSRTSTPCSRSDAATASPAAGSSGGSRRSLSSISVTCEPSARQAVAISQPTTPPPTTSSRPGTSLALVASRGVHGSISRSPSTGGTAASEPVQTATACRAVSRRSVPSESVTTTVFSPSSRPAPRTRVMPAPRTHSACPASSQFEVNRVRRSSVAATSCCPVTAWAAPATARASASTSVPRSSALLGMQAQ